MGVDGMRVVVNGVQINEGTPSGLLEKAATPMTILANDPFHSLATPTDYMRRILSFCMY